MVAVRLCATGNLDGINSVSYLLELAADEEMFLVFIPESKHFQSGSMIQLPSMCSDGAQLLRLIDQI